MQQNFRMRSCRLTCSLWILLLYISLPVVYGGSTRPLKGLTRTLKSSSNEELHEAQEEPPAALDPSSLPYCTIVGSVSGLVAGLVLILGVCIIWECRKTSIRSYIFSAQRKNMVEKEVQLRKQSQKMQEELDTLIADLSLSMEVKGGLSNQREQFRLQIEEIEKEREENKEKLHSVQKEIAEGEREKATDRVDGYLREKQNLLNAQWKLEKRKEEVEKQQLNMEKLLQKTEGMIATMTERKKKVENRMEVIHSLLEEAESPDQTTHLHRE